MVFPRRRTSFHDFIPLLADRFHVVAPDYPGMGYSVAPEPNIVRPTFDDVTKVIDAFIAQRMPGPVILYMHDFGGPDTPEKVAEAEQSASEARDQYLHKTGAHRPDALNPDSGAIDAYAFGIPASRTFMTRMLMNIPANVPHYPEWIAFLETRQPKTLIVWGRNDPLMAPAGAEVIKENVPAADLRFFDGGHFVLDEYAYEVADAVIETFSC